MAAPWARGAQVRIIGRLHGQETNNVWHLATNTVVSDGPNLDALLLQLCIAIAQCISDELLPGVTSNWTFESVEAKVIHPVLSDPVVHTVVQPAVGALGPTSVSFASSLVHIRSGMGGRSGRGRMFLPPAGEANTADSLIDAPTLAQLGDFILCIAGKFVGAGATEPWRLGILSRKQLSAQGGTFDNSFREATQLNAVQAVAAMGSRKIGRGA